MSCCVEVKDGAEEVTVDKESSPQVPSPHMAPDMDVEPPAKVTEPAEGPNPPPPAETPNNVAAASE